MRTRKYQVAFNAAIGCPVELIGSIVKAREVRGERHNFLILSLLLGIVVFRICLI